MIRISDIYDGNQKKKDKEEKKEQKEKSVKREEKIVEVEKTEIKKSKEKVLEEDIDFKGEEKRDKIIEEFNMESAEVSYNQGILLLKEMFNNIRAGNLNFPQGLLEVLRWFKDNLKDKGEILFFIFEDTPSYYLIAHSLNVSIICMKILLDMNKDDLEMLAIGVAGLVHDVGMVNVMNLVAEKRKLSANEYALVKEHVIRGYELVKNMDGLGAATKKFILPIIRYHHERFNGKGYPEGLKGEGIPFYSRIMGLVDIFEALSHTRPYRAATSPAIALQKIIRLESEGWFDYNILRQFIESFSFYPIGSKVKLNTDEVALVVGVNKGQPTRPYIKIIDGPNKGALKNLLNDPLTYIKEGLK